mmetsp:Transcript_26889/g.34501  ORF Transcript_26889/g.34501 Transcript_26889/m.34501 type:complete len:559 (-) Transcript_26889:303-1979(-)
MNIAWPSKKENKSNRLQHPPISTKFNNNPHMASSTTLATTMVQPPKPRPPPPSLPPPGRNSTSNAINAKKRPPPPPLPNNNRGGAVKPPPPPPRMKQTNGVPPPPPPPNRPPPPPPRPNPNNRGVAVMKKPPPPPRPPVATAAKPIIKKRTAPEISTLNNTTTTRTTAAPNADARKRQRQEQQNRRVSLKAPVVMRDVTAFQKKHQVGEGTYGSVFVGADKITGEIVALKRINTEEEENGFPITAIREVKILKALHHSNIVQLKEIVTSKDQGDIPKNVFMVFEYLEYDLTGIIESPEIKISQDHIKSWSKQLLSGVHYMHVNKIIHRDLKSSNLLINKRGELKIADWGLARSWNKEMKRLTNRVITLWYRPPELLLGCNQYTTKIDMWSVGCIIAEMFRRGGLLKGSTEANQLDLIFRMMGHPTREDWPDIDKMCPLWKNFEPKSGEQVFPRRVREELKARLPTSAMNWMTPHAIDLIDSLLAHNPEKRWSADKALLAEYFFDNPTFKPASELNMKFGVESAHEWEARKKHKEMMAKKLAARGLPAPGSSSSGRTKS